MLLANPQFAAFMRMVDIIVWRGILDGRFADRGHAIDVFNRHIDEVRKQIPADRLLVYEVAEGWEPLCAFLGVDVPDAPFPNVNNTGEFLRQWRRRMAPLLIRPALAAAGAGLGVAVVARLLRRRR
jgi:hypothetical protein